MIVYQLMYHDGYYPSSPINDKVYQSREAARKAFDEMNLVHGWPLDSIEKYELSEEEEEYCDYFISELEVI